MGTKRLISLMLFVLLFLGAAISPSYAHQKRRYDPSHKPAWRYIAHSHDADTEKEGMQEVADDKDDTKKSDQEASKKEAKKPTRQPQHRRNRTGFRFGMPGRK
jgi:hypothetical protein